METSSKAPDLPTRAARLAAGKALRRTVPREAHGAWQPDPHRADPVAVLIESGRQRLPALLPERYRRMMASPFAFLRGAAAIMAADLATTPASGPTVQACGDCHLMNFGAYLSPEGHGVFDINDFDETLEAPFEWDVKRLATSVVLAGRDAGLGAKAGLRAARAAVGAYRTHMAALAALDPFEIWLSRIDLAAILGEAGDPALVQRETARLKGEDGANPALYAYPRLVEGRRIKDHPPLIYHIEAAGGGPEALDVAALLAAYRATLPEAVGQLVDRYRLADAAFKVVGVGSVGTFCAIALVTTGDGEPLFLQIKEAQRSVLASHGGRTARTYDNEGRRVVLGQRAIQAASDIFLGWARDPHRGRDFYVRQLKDQKLALIGEELERSALAAYAVLCGTTLARAHARSGDPATIAGYLGTGEAFDAAIAEFAAAYADQTERDHARLVEAKAAGRITVAAG